MIPQAAQRPDGPAPGRTLVLLSEPNEATFHQLRQDLIRAGRRPVMEHYPSAFVLLDARPLVERLRQDGRIFGAFERSISNETLQRLPAVHRPIAEGWNHSLSESYQKHQRLDPFWEDQSWATVPGRSGCVFTGRWDPRALELRLLKRLDISPEQQRGWLTEHADRQLPPTDAIRRLLAERGYSPQLTRELSNVVARLSPAFLYGLLLNTDPAAVTRAMTGDLVCRMEGAIAVGVVFVESWIADPFNFSMRFSDSERQTVKQKIEDGLMWLANREPLAGITWSFDWQEVLLGVDLHYITKVNCTEFTAADPFWRDPAMAKVEYFGTHFSADSDGIQDYRDAMIQHTQASYGIVIFVTTLPNCWHGYVSDTGVVVLAASPSFEWPFIQPKHSWDGWPLEFASRITIHEVCHLFGASDEYSGKGSACLNCSDLFGEFQIPNGNCAKCARPHQACIMSKNKLRMCAYTQAHIGWADLFVELETDDEKWAGTDDWVLLDIGDREFQLDNPDFNDRERGHVEGYALNYTKVARKDIKRIGLRKVPAGVAGGWKARHIRVWHQGELICDEDIDVWIEDDYPSSRWWVAKSLSDPASGLINHLQVVIVTADQTGAGTDDEVTIRLGKRGPWILDNVWQNDFQSGTTTSFVLDPGVGFYVSELNSLELRKSEDGVHGAWRIKDVWINVNGATVYKKLNINTWLQGSNLVFSDTF